MRLEIKIMEHNKSIGYKLKRVFSNKIFLGLAFFLLILGSLGIYFSLDKFSKRETTEVSNEYQQTGSIVKFKELPDYSDITSNWVLHSISEDKQLSFKLPPDWKYLELWDKMPPSFAYGVQSPDFKLGSLNKILEVLKGSILIVAVDSRSTSIFGNNITIDEVAEDKDSGNAKVVGYFKVAGLDAAKYIYHGVGKDNTGEDNTGEGIVFRKGENFYVIWQRYRLGSPNPYPGISEQVASTITFNQ